MSLDPREPPGKEPTAALQPRPVDAAEQARLHLLERVTAYRPPVGGATTAQSFGPPQPEPAQALSGAPGMHDAGAVLAPGSAAAAGTSQPRELPKAFARAIPAATTSDPAWELLALGSAGKAQVTLRVGADGKLADYELERPVAEHLERLVERSVLALREGRFVLVGAQAGEQVLVLSARISRRLVKAGPLELGYDAPRVARPGRAYFELPSGRFVEVEVAIQQR